MLYENAFRVNELTSYGELNRNWSADCCDGGGGGEGGGGDTSTRQKYFRYA